MDKYNKSVQHQWFHHATWGSPKYESKGVGKVIWHSLTEDGKVERVHIKFGNEVYENVDVSHLKPLKVEAHGHPAAKDDEENPKRKKNAHKKKVKEIIIKGKRYRPVW